MANRIYERAEAESRLAELMARARKGETILIAENGEVVARLIPVQEKASRRAGETRKRAKISPEFEATDARLARMQSEGDVPRRLRKLPKR
jgi:prevent-host-death family protein